MPNNLSDPSWKSGPPEPKYSHNDHDIYPEDFVYDFDGPSKKQADKYHSEIFTVVIEGAECGREGCDCGITNYHIYTLADVGGDVIQRVGEYLEEKYDFPIDDELLTEHCAMNCEIIDYDDDSPVLGITVGDDVLGYITPTDTESGSISGTCHGYSEPDPDIVYEDRHDI